MLLFRNLLFLVPLFRAVSTKIAHAFSAATACKTQILKTEEAKKPLRTSLLQASTASSHKGKKETSSRDYDYNALPDELRDFNRLSNKLMADLYMAQQHAELSRTADRATAEPEILLKHNRTNSSSSLPDPSSQTVGLSWIWERIPFEVWRFIIIFVLCGLVMWRASSNIAFYLGEFVELNAWTFYLPACFVWLIVSVELWWWARSGSLRIAIDDPLNMIIIFAATLLLPLATLICSNFHAKILSPVVKYCKAMDSDIRKALEKITGTDLNNDGKVEPHAFKCF